MSATPIYYVTAADAATLRQIADERGLSAADARCALELDPHSPADDEMLSPVIAGCFRLVLDS